MALELYKNVGKYKIYKPGETLFQQGAQGDCMFIVTKGVFSVYVNTFADLPAKVADVTEGAFLGEMAVIDGSPRSATVVSAKQGVAISVDKEHFGDLLREHPDTAEKILKTLLQRFDSTAAIVRESGGTAEELPVELKTSIFSGGDYDPKIAFDSMCFLAKRIRELNSQLQPNSGQDESCFTKNPAVLKLLPEGHGEFQGSDKLDNSKLLASCEFSCPCCGTSFSGYVPVFTRLQEKEKSIAGHVIYRNFNILFYLNSVCPKCNYCDTYNEFLQKRESPLFNDVKGCLFPNEEAFTGYKDAFTHTFQEAILSYYLNIQCLQKVPNSQLRIAKSWERLHWLYCHFNTQQHKKWGLYAAKNAAEQFEAFVAANKAILSGENLLNLNAILGELYAVLGETDKARSCFKANTQVLGFLTHELAEKSSARLREIGG
jgi:uncharacterized protein (DUF2225 family)